MTDWQDAARLELRETLDGGQVVTASHLRLIAARHQVPLYEVRDVFDAVCEARRREHLQPVRKGAWTL